MRASSSTRSTPASTRARYSSGSAAPPERCSRMYSRSTCSTSDIGLSGSIARVVETPSQCCLEALGDLVDVRFRLTCLLRSSFRIGVVEPVQLDDAPVLVTAKAAHG